MQRWADEFSKAPIFTTIKNLRACLDVELVEADPVTEIERLRFAKYVNFLDQTVTELDPDLAPLDVLSTINNALSSHGATATATRLISSQDANLFRELNTQVDPTLSYLNQLSRNLESGIGRKSDLDVASISFEKFSRKISETSRRLSREVEDVKKSALEAVALIQTSSQEIAKSQLAFEAKLADWNAQQTELMAQQKADFASEQSNQKIAHSVVVRRELDDFSLKLKTFHAEQEQLMEKSRNELDVNMAASIKQAQIYLEKIENFYEMTAVTSVTGGHKNVADREYKSAFEWRTATLVFVAFTVAWVLLSYFFFTPQIDPPELFWLGVGKSVSLTAILISLAVYASKQSSLHRRNETKARAFFLQVQAFDPFVANLPAEKQTELKEALSARIFGVDEHTRDQSSKEEANFEGFDKFFYVAEKIKGLISKS